MLFRLMSFCIVCALFYVIYLLIYLFIFRSPEKFQVTYCDHASSVVVRKLSTSSQEPLDQF